MSIFLTIGLATIISGTLLSGIKLNKDWERSIVLRLGKYNRDQKGGLYYKIPFIEDHLRVSTREQVMNVDAQNIITKDSVSVKIDAIVYYKIREKHFKKAILNVENWEKASTTLAQTKLRDEIGKKTLDEILENKKEISKEIEKTLDEKTDQWGIKVEAVEIKEVSIPKNMERAMAMEAEASREKKARVTKAEGEEKAAEILKKAGDELGKNKNAMTLRQLQTYQEIGSEQNSMLIVTPVEGMLNQDYSGLASLARNEMEKNSKKDSKKKG